MQTVLIIRRLRCTPCRRIHHELPDCLVSYKWYDAASIEAGLTEGQTAPVAVDESTLNRWRRWYAVWVVYTAGCLAALAARPDATGLERQTSRSFPAVLQLLGSWVGDAMAGPGCPPLGESSVVAHIIPCFGKIVFTTLPN